MNPTYKGITRWLFNNNIDFKNEVSYRYKKWKYEIFILGDLNNEIVSYFEKLKTEWTRYVDNPKSDVYDWGIATIGSLTIKIPEWFKIKNPLNQGEKSNETGDDLFMT